MYRLSRSISLNNHQDQLTACGTSTGKMAEAGYETDSLIVVSDQIKSLKIQNPNPGINIVSRTVSPVPTAMSSSLLSGSRQNLVTNATSESAIKTSPLEAGGGSCKLYNFNKWACPLCTYENWPKSGKCSMCNHFRLQETSIIGAVGGSEISKTTSTESIGYRFTLLPEKELIYDEHDGTSGNPKRVHIRNVQEVNNLDIQGQQERRVRQIRRQADRQWLFACIGIVDNNFSSVEEYLACGGSPTRALTSNEVLLLNRNSAFDVGQTLIHLAIRFHREEMLPSLLARISNGSNQSFVKRVPSYIAPELAADIRRHFASSLRIKKVPFNCYYVTEFVTFVLPAEIEELPVSIQEQLHDELLDRDAQQQLESPPPALNWSMEITTRLTSRLWVLWNRSAGDCLLDSAMQATYGVFDRDNVLRRALSDTLHQCGRM